jgi:hypothetical protein
MGVTMGDMTGFAYFYSTKKFGRESKLKNGFRPISEQNRRCAIAQGKRKSVWMQRGSHRMKRGDPDGRYRKSRDECPSEIPVGSGFDSKRYIREGPKSGTIHNRLATLLRV